MCFECSKHCLENGILNGFCCEEPIDCDLWTSIVLTNGELFGWFLNDSFSYKKETTFIEFVMDIICSMLHIKPQLDAIPCARCLQKYGDDRMFPGLK